MKERPTIETERLVLRPFTLDDAGEVQRLAGDKAIAATTLRLPHPYEDGVAEEWIGTHQEKFEKDELVNLAIAHRRDGHLIGAIGLTVNRDFENAELGYWIGKEFWRQGYCTEAARAVVGYGFEQMGLHKIHANHFKGNPASGSVMRKVGMSAEGVLREHVKKWDRFVDIVCYAILADEYVTSRS